MNIINELGIIFPDTYERVYNYIMLLEEMTHTDHIDNLDEVFRRDGVLSDKSTEIIMILTEAYVNLCSYIGLTIDPDNFILSDVYDLILSLEDANKLDGVNKEDIINHFSVIEDKIDKIVYLLNYIGHTKTGHDYNIIDVSDTLIKAITTALREADTDIDLTAIASKTYHIELYKNLGCEPIGMSYDFDYIFNIISILESEITSLSIDAIMYTILFSKEGLSNPEEAYDMYVVPLIRNSTRFETVNSIVKSFIVKIGEMK